jgi:hypothetical protein
MAQRKSFLLRMDPALWTELERWAADELRSVNGQIEYVLKHAVQNRKRGGGSRSVPQPLAPSETQDSTAEPENPAAE